MEGIEWLVIACFSACLSICGNALQILGTTSWPVQCVCRISHHKVLRTTAATFVGSFLFGTLFKLLGRMVPNEELELVPNFDAFAGELKNYN